MSDVYYAHGDAPAHSFIQWKGTDVCLDFHCECGTHAHFDGDFAYVIVCPACGAEWEQPATIPLRRNDRPEEFGGKVYPS